MMFIQELLTEIRQKPLENFMGLCVMVIAVFGAAIKDVASAVFLIFILTSIFYVKQWPQAWRSLGDVERLLLTGFLLYMASGFLSYVNVADDYEFIKQMGRYLRFALIVPLYLFLVRTDLNLTRFLMAGVVLSGPVYLLIALLKQYNYPGSVGSGEYHHIIFGDAAMLNAMLILAFLVTKKFSVFTRLLFIASMSCAIYASILSTARGAWLAAPVLIVMLAWYAVKTRSIRIRGIYIIIAIVLAMIALSPVRDLIATRSIEAVNEVKMFSSGEGAGTSVGGRLALWDVAIKVWKENPVLGTGAGDYNDDLVDYQSQGLYPEVYVHDSVHNIYLQALASTGIVGLLVFILVFIVFPLLFLKRVKHGGVELERLSGLVLIVSVLIFGLTESWTLRSPFIAIYVIYLVVIFSQAGKGLRDVKQPP